MRSAAADGRSPLVYEGRYPRHCASCFTQRELCSSYRFVPCRACRSCATITGQDKSVPVQPCLAAAGRVSTITWKSVRPVRVSDTSLSIWELCTPCTALCAVPFLHASPRGELRGLPDRMDQKLRHPPAILLPAENVGCQSITSSGVRVLGMLQSCVTRIRHDAITS